MTWTCTTVHDSSLILSYCQSSLHFTTLRCPLPHRSLSGCSFTVNPSTGLIFLTRVLIDLVTVVSVSPVVHGSGTPSSLEPRDLPAVLRWHRPRLSSLSQGSGPFPLRHYRDRTRQSQDTPVHTPSLSRSDRNVRRLRVVLRTKPTRPGKTVRDSSSHTRRSTLPLTPSTPRRSTGTPGRHQTIFPHVSTPLGESDPHVRSGIFGTPWSDFCLLPGLGESLQQVLTLVKGTSRTPLACPLESPSDQEYLHPFYPWPSVVPCLPPRRVGSDPRTKVPGRHTGTRSGKGGDTKVLE